MVDPAKKLPSWVTTDQENQPCSGFSGAFADFEGGIMIDNVPLRNYNTESFRMQTGVLISQQDIFNGTLLENITMGDEQILPEEIMKLSEKLGFNNFLEEQEQGFSTMLDPVGKRLSRTVIQKILLLRALINHPRLLLLEEPWQTGRKTITGKNPGVFVIQARVTVFVESNDDDFAAGRCDQFLKMTH